MCCRNCCCCFTCLDYASAEPATCAAAAAAAVLVCAHVAHSEEVELPRKHSYGRASKEYPTIVSSKPSLTCVKEQTYRHWDATAPVLSHALPSNAFVC